MYPPTYSLSRKVMKEVAWELKLPPLDESKMAEIKDIRVGTYLGWIPQSRTTE